MTDRAECLICGRPSLSTGEPDCRCWTHSLSHPVDPPQHGPDPADVALFPLDSAGRPGPPAPAAAPPPRDADSVVVHGSHRPPASHRKPRERHRIAAAAGGAVAAVVGCTALAASLLGGNGRHEQVLDTDGTGPSVALPDGQEVLPDRGEPPPEPEGDTPRPGPTPETEGTERPDTGEPEPDPSPTTGGPDPTPT
ncbi:hypothetical protein RM779_14040, partial [Streptomyces sp. DSM 41886]|nr:hypothetical protein [Streptomyces sp. DSM 41886]